MVDYEAEGKQMPDFNALDKRDGHSELPEWAVRQQKVFTNWINNKVAERGLKVDDLFQDLQDGVVLFNLLEVLSKQSLAVLGKLKPERNKIRKVANMNIVWKYLGTTVKLVGIGPTDIVAGHTTLTLGMIWSLIVFFMAKDLGDSGEDLAALKRRIMEWLKARTKHTPDVDVRNFTDSLADGRAFMALMNGADPVACPYKPSADPVQNLKQAFSDAERLYGVGAILDAEDPACCADEKANITYLAELMKVMPGLDIVLAPVKKDPKQAALEYAHNHRDATVEKLKQLCAYTPQQNEAAAGKVAAFMSDAGLTGVKLIQPSDSTSLLSAPFVVGDKAGPPGSPTVLLYATYGINTDDEDTVAKWTSDPFDAIVADGRVIAKGAAHDKANVIAPLAAIEAMLKSLDDVDTLPCNIRVLIGSTLPHDAVRGSDLPLQLADKLAEFIRAHPEDIGSPDYVVVSEPNGSFLGPDKAAVGVSCRGFASIDMHISTFTERETDYACNLPADKANSGKERALCAKYGGPIIDAGYALAVVLASLRDTEDGSNRVEGLKVVPDKTACDKLRGVHYGEHHLRPETGYHHDVPCAKDTYVRDGTIMHATLAEQLTVLPAVTVAAISMGNTNAKGVNGPLSSAYAPTAHATLHLCLAPDQEVHAAVKALKQHCLAVAPFGCTVEFTNQVGHIGWATHPHTAIVEAYSACRTLAECKRGLVVVGAPDFKPVPSAFAAALPGAKVVSFGVHDGKRSTQPANESVKTEDLFDFVRTHIELVHYIGHGPPGKDSAASDTTQPSTPVSINGDAKTSYSNKFMNDLDRRNAANQMRAGNLGGTGTLPMGAVPVMAATPLSPDRRESSVSPTASTAAARQSLSPNKNKLSLSPDARASFAASGRGDSILSMSTAGGSRGSALAPSPPRDSAGSVGFSSTNSYSEGIVAGPPPLPPRVRGASASNDPNMSTLAAKVIEEINLMRSDPGEYAKRELEPLIACFGKGGVFTSPNMTDKPRVTSEGVKPLQEAITVLKQASPLPALVRVEGIDNASMDHAKDMSASGQTSHTGSDGSKAADRINRYGQFYQVAGEVLALYESTPAGIVAQLLISDGERTRQNRKSLLATHFKVCGAATSPHPNVGTVCVITLCGGFGPKPLETAACVTVAGGDAPDAAFNRVLESIPVPQVSEEVNKALASGLTVELDYKPGEVKLNIQQPDGGITTLACQWA